ncbi:MAG: EamA family transporter [Micromonosporaceae bacterium]|nr:EamA family transporter [Micromonosporaceae bacterium]
MSAPYPHERRRDAGLVLALTAALTFGSSGPFAKPLIEAGLSPLQVTWLRVAGAALVMLPLAVRHRGLLWRRPTLVIGYGLFAIAGVQAFYFAALARIPVGVAILIEFLGPVLVLLWIRFGARRPVSRRAAVGVVLAVTGIACVVEVWSGLRFDVIGLLLGFGAAMCQVVFFVLSDVDDATDDSPASPIAMISHGFLVGAVALTVIAQPWRIDWQVMGAAVPVGDSAAHGALLVGWIILVSTVIAYLAGVNAVRRLSAQVAAAVACLEVVVAAAVAWIALGEALSAVQIVGGVVVLAGAFVAQTAAVAKSSATPAPEPEPQPEPAPA